ncbi:MAG: RagB/SusD family nutrient uptake outer membrane protein [Bacteroidales bacterium]|nr:RagB/SusD family nutrient uptake outer membrane protein [Candidatus Cryptobacteroides aphodequi]
MKNIFTKSLAVIAMAVMGTACDLNLYPEGSIVMVDGEPLFQKSSDVESFGVGVYTYFRACNGSGSCVPEELMFGGFNAVSDYGNNYGPIHRLDKTFTSGDDDVEGYWGNNYISINNYNIVIDEADKVAGTELEAAARKIQGDAYFARAFSYLQLARHFGPAYDAAKASTDLCVPLVLHYDQHGKPARATVKAVYDQIKADLDSAMVRLTAAGKTGNTASQEFTTDAVTALYARYYLDVADYAKAVEAAAGLINNSAYALSESQDALDSMWRADNTKEAILQMYASQAEAPSSITAFTGYGTDTRSTTGYAYKPLFIPSKALLALYKATDYRYKVWFSSTSTDPIIVNASSFKNIMIFSKYLGNVEYNSSGIPSGQVAAKPLKIGEMYLIAAEASYMDGDDTAAKNYLNQLQSKRSGTISKTATIEAIRDEWTRETVCEGLTLANYKRWGIGFTTREAQDAAVNNSVIMTGADYDGKSLNDGDYHLTWPIPAYERKINKNLVQNKGYEELN